MPVLQSIASIGTIDLHYLSAIQPPYSDEIDIERRIPDYFAWYLLVIEIVVTDPVEGIEWDYDTGTLIYTLINPALMPEMNIPIDYSVAYAEISSPGGMWLPTGLLVELVSFT